MLDYATYMKLEQCLVVAGAAVSDGRLMLLVVVATVVVDVVAVAQQVGTQADHSSQKQFSCKAAHLPRVGPDNILFSLIKYCKRKVDQSWKTYKIF